jgi:FkbM family methyltransferase
MANKYFIDCGAHCGESILRARAQFGNDITIISYEAVPELANALAELYQDDDNVHVVNAAVYTTDDVIDINICPSFTDGSSIRADLNNNHLSTKVKVPCFNLSNWIKESFDTNDYIILKLDDKIDKKVIIINFIS